MGRQKAELLRDGIDDPHEWENTEILLLTCFICYNLAMK